MLFQAEDIGLLFLAVPVATDALEDAGAIVQGMGHYPYFGFFQRDKLLLKKGVRRHFTVSFPVTVHYSLCGDRKTSAIIRG